MRLTIIADDNKVIVDGVGREVAGLTALLPDVHAVQFYGTTGEIEFKDRTIPNEAISDIIQFQPVIELWVAAGVIPPDTLEQAKAKRAAFMDSEYERINQLPILYLGNTFQADNTSTDLMDKAISTLTAIGGTTGITWWNIANVGVPLTYSEFAGLSAAILSRGQLYFANKRVKKDLINAATTIAEVEAITWLT